MRTANKQGVPGDGARVQRQVDDLPVLHLEADIPSPDRWEVTVDGVVRNHRTWTLEELHAMPAEVRVWDLSCVWGWTRPACRWEGIPAGRLIDEADLFPEANYVLVHAVEGNYASCLTLDEARAGLLAWGLDGRSLPPEHGGPLRFVPPPTKWGYKGIKWVGRLTVLPYFKPGFWEDMVGDPHGDIPLELLGGDDETKETIGDR